MDTIKIHTFYNGSSNSSIRYGPLFDETLSPRQQKTLINDAPLFDKLPYSMKVKFPLKIELENVNSNNVKGALQ